ncbi:hypothetical protein [Alteromonas sp. ASW11-130]|uniref:hypothetical protein n=1 Tax=Alteromonas sp. ASW11-130 TaxID=3015775 RepID=UPI002242442B|nr:hypothetical protein [Alteromonas sp. ASW11-130]MCW8092849.1 hypothetical protein [Alteromonas sp. ASW11-130]
MQTIMIEDPFISRAALFSARNFALAGCFSPYSGHAFINHPKAVATKLAQFSHSKNLLACAWLHAQMAFQLTDALELEEKFGRDITRLITQLTQLRVPFSADNEVLMRLNLAGVRRASAEIQTLVLIELLVLGETVSVFRPSQLKHFSDWLTRSLDEFSMADPELFRQAQMLTREFSTKGLRVH